MLSASVHLPNHLPVNLLLCCRRCSVLAAAVSQEGLCWVRHLHFQQQRNAEAYPHRTLLQVLLASVLAAVVSQAGLGSAPAFRVPTYTLATPFELPLFLVFGILCGAVSSVSTYSTKVNIFIRSHIACTYLPFCLGLGILCGAVSVSAYSTKASVLIWCGVHVQQRLP